MTAYFIVRAEVLDVALKDDFDHWYQKEHLPDAKAAFNARRAWRGWSNSDATVHYACYEFDDLASAQAVLASDALKRLAAEFDRVWSDTVLRGRDIVETIQTIGA